MLCNGYSHPSLCSLALGVLATDMQHEHVEPLMASYLKTLGGEPSCGPRQGFRVA